MSDSARLFLALWPEPPLRARLSAYRDAWCWPPGAKPVQDATLHLTLHFLGAVARVRIPGLATSLAAVAVEEVVLRAAGGEVWKGGIAVLRIAASGSLFELHERLGAVLTDAGIALDPRPFAPHVTLARKAATAKPPTERPVFDWRADGFALVESLPGGAVRYEPLARFGAIAQARSGPDSG